MNVMAKIRTVIYCKESISVFIELGLRLKKVDLQIHKEEFYENLVI